MQRDNGPQTTAGNEPSKLLPILFVVINIVVLYVIYMSYHCLPLLAHRSSASRAMFEIILFNVLTFLILVSFIRACLTHPGTIPSAETGDMTWEYRPSKPFSSGNSMNSMSSMLGLGLQEKKKTGERRHCKWCAKYKPDRAHHCRVCRQCILKMDHHCPWIGNCVGFRNHKYFFLVVMYSSIATNMIIWTMIESVQTTLDTTVPFSKMFMLIFGETLASFLGLVVTAFFLFHVWLMLRGMTTIEFCEKSMKRDLGNSVHNRGCYGNICAVLGDNPCVWLWPGFPPSGNGINFNQQNEDSRLMKDMEAGRGIQRLKMKAKGPKKKKRGMAGTGEWAGSETSGAESGLSSIMSLSRPRELMTAKDMNIDSIC
jgi:hypothetical protein